MRLITAVLILFLVLLQYRLWFGKNSVPDYLAIEERARHELGMIKQGETFFRVIPNDDADEKEKLR
jgi:cell division protein FtsB